MCTGPSGYFALTGAEHRSRRGGGITLPRSPGPSSAPGRTKTGFLLPTRVLQTSPYAAGQPLHSPAAVCLCRRATMTP